MPDSVQNNSTSSIQVGNPIGDWEGLDPVTPYLHLAAPAVSKSNSTPDQSKYPNVVGSRRLAVTDTAQNIRKRSWMGWFLWGDGTPPPGITPGYPVNEASPPLYNNDNWDYFSWQYSAGDDPNNGQWKAIRLDQQPLYLNPFRINYNWAPGRFGYQTQPLLPFKNNVGYWADKKIVRGPNLSLAYPYLVEYGDYIDKTKVPNFPDEWRNSWLYIHTRPLETLVMVPGIKTPAELLTPGSWNQVGTDHQPFPYPVWDETLGPADQTPFCIKVDRMGDWDADLIWEGTHANAANYDQNKYQPTAFHQPGKGNYLKMTVAQGSPLIWCETNNSQYVNFYNLIRTNELGHIADTGGTLPTNAGMAIDPNTQQGVWDVPGVENVQYVLLYGNQTNPNQFYQEVEPFKWDAQTGSPGGWNPPGQQSNHTYIAIYFKKDTVVPVDLSQHSGTDGDGNPYFYLEFLNKNQKNWYVVGAIPVMRYYSDRNLLPEDDAATRLTAARQWAEAMGAYAFNFLTNTQISYQVTNMYLATTTYQTTVTNPFVAAGQPNASNMTAAPTKTVMALLPHHYQPITLGPVDPSQPHGQQIVWQPLQTTGAELPIGTIHLPNANKSDPASSSHWGYWGPRGNLKTLATDQFVTSYLFQNFLPLLPPPNWDKEYQQTSIQGVRIVDVGSGYVELPTDVDAPPANALPQATIVSSEGSGAELQVVLEPHTDRIQQINVTNGGSGYPNGNPPPEVTVQIDPPNPKVPGGRTASARAQVSGGNVVAVFMNDQGAGYRSTIQIATTSQHTTDPAIVLPRFDAQTKALTGGLANVVVGGAGWVGDPSATVTATVQGTGTGATAEVIQPGQMLQVNQIGFGFTSGGTYPSSGNPAQDAASVTVNVPPPAQGGPAQTMNVTAVSPTGKYFKTLITDPGEGYSNHANGVNSVQCVTQDGSVIKLSNILFDLGAAGGRIIVADPDQSVAPFTQPFTQPLQVTFKPAPGENTPTREATATLYPGFSVQGVELTGSAVSGYQDDVEISFSGGDAAPASLVLPELTLEVVNGGIAKATVQSAGSGFYRGGWFDVEGGKGFNAACVPVVRPVTDSAGKITYDLLAVKVLRPGSNYPENIVAYAQDTQARKQLAVTVEAGQVIQVNLMPDVDYTNLNTIPPIFLISQSGWTNGGDYNSDPPKGKKAQIYYSPTANGGVQVDSVDPGEGYISGSSTATVDSLPAILRYGDIVQIATANQASGFMAEVAKPVLKVEQVLYDSLVSRFSLWATSNLKPFGGGFGGATAPDGYGLGNTLSSVAKVLGVLYHLQQHYASKNQDLPSVRASLFAILQTLSSDPAQFEFPIYVENNPLVSLKGGLQTMTQALQRTLSLFFQQVPYTNTPPDTDQTWPMAYFAQYDPAGRVVVNPTATIPVYGVVSSIMDPPAVPAEQNQAKQGLNRWNPGMLWSGFGVSDQWNDQHYFYGYYLSTAALVSLLDGCWSDTKPAHLWADPDQMGTAIDQWLKTLVYDPTLEKEGQYFDFNQTCQSNQITYSKYAFFDQWNGHPWAAGVSPGRAGDVSDGQKKPFDPWSVWMSYGTGNFSFDDENENSTWEGLQAYSAAILWGAGSNRKAIVDQGIYLLTTGNAASDLYFLDKNYNLKHSSQNQYTWCPLTTGTPASQKDGGNHYPTHTGFVDACPTAFYGDASAGCSILQKGSPSLNNFFYAFPTGSKFIQAYPPTPWTMGMTRNLSYMQQWADVFTRAEWTDARNSALFQAGNWLGMAMTSSLCGVPYNPGDDPTKTQPYVNRVWSSWNVVGQEPGSQVTGMMQPSEQPTSVLNLLHVIEEYGTPDWSIYAKVTDQTGAEANEIVFTAAFTQVNPQNSSVTSTLVAFNPGWETRYVLFYHLAADGNLSHSQVVAVNNSQPIAVPPKKMVVIMA
nr:MAG: hypothetical protein EDM05_17650 [Leptolyngbya sp. IPPAS B-1204]